MFRTLAKYPLYSLLLLLLLGWGIWALLSYTDRKHAVRAEGMTSLGADPGAKGEPLLESAQGDNAPRDPNAAWAQANPSGMDSFANVDNLLSADFQSRINILSPPKRNVNMQERADPVIDGMGQNPCPWYQSTIVPGPRQGIDVQSSY